MKRVSTKEQIKELNRSIVALSESLINTNNNIKIMLDLVIKEEERKLEASLSELLYEHNYNMYYNKK